MSKTACIPVAAVVLALCSLFSCKNTPKDGTPTALTTQEAAPSNAPKPEISLYAVVVDKLNLREQASKDAKVKYQFAEGDFAEGTGAISQNKEEATLRGITYTEPYAEVVSTTPEQHKGWAYLGALQLVYAGSRAGSPDLGTLSQLTAFLKDLDVKNINSGKKAWDYVKTNLASANGSTADAAFILLERFMNRMSAEGEFYKTTENIQWADTDYQAVAEHRFDPNRYPQTQAFAANGFRLETGEGMIFPVVDPAPFNVFFLSKVTPAMRAYLEQQLKEQNQQAFDDGGIIVSLEILADRAAFWEKFNKENPNFALSDRTIESQRWLELVMTNGSDNSPVFDFETQAVRPDFPKVWAYIQERYPNTDLAQQVKTFSALVAAEGNKRTAKVEAAQSEIANRYSD